VNAVGEQDHAGVLERARAKFTGGEVERQRDVGQAFGRHRYEHVEQAKRIGDGAEVRQPRGV
jgi:hypothetical protein